MRTGHAVICASHRRPLSPAEPWPRCGCPCRGQLSIVTFGDSGWARAYRPAVAVIRFDRYREARRATYEVLVVLRGLPELEDMGRESVGLCLPPEI